MNNTEDRERTEQQDLDEVFKRAYKAVKPIIERERSVEFAGDVMDIRLDTNHMKEKGMNQVETFEFLLTRHRKLLEIEAASETEDREQLRFRLFHYAPFDGTSHTTSCTIWREDGQGHAKGFDGDRGPCNCGALENFQRLRAEFAEAQIKELLDKENNE